MSPYPGTWLKSSKTICNPCLCEEKGYNFRPYPQLLGLKIRLPLDLQKIAATPIVTPSVTHSETALHWDLSESLTPVVTPSLTPRPKI